MNINVDVKQNENDIQVNIAEISMMSFKPVMSNSRISRSERFSSFSEPPCFFTILKVPTKTPNPVLSM